KDVTTVRTLTLSPPDLDRGAGGVPRGAPARPRAQESVMRGRVLLAWIVSVLLVPAAGAQLAPVPPPAGRVAQTAADDLQTGAERPRPPQILPYNYTPMMSAVPPPQLPPD